MNKTWVAVLLLLALATFVGVVRLADGPRLSPDSTGYLDAAASLRAGLGWRSHFTGNEDFTWWPPLFPAVLALSPDPMAFGAGLNAASFVATVALAYALVLRYGAGRGAAFGAGLAVTIGGPSLYVHGYLWSEPLFGVLLLAWLLALTYTDHPAGLLVAGALAALATMQRYVGALLLPVGALALAWAGRRTGGQAAVRIAAYLLPGALALTWWLTRNTYLAGVAAGIQGEAGVTFVESAWLTVVTVACWLPTLALCAAIGGLLDARFKGRAVGIRGAVPAGGDGAGVAYGAERARRQVIIPAVSGSGGGVGGAVGPLARGKELGKGN